MFREDKITALEEDLRLVSMLLKKIYRHDFLSEFNRIEKELEIQKCYLQHERFLSDK
jgi:TATA-binding protein-associated factor Taf7